MRQRHRTNPWQLSDDTAGRARQTSPAVRLMQQSRQMALSGVPFAYQAIAYELGKYHRPSNIDWDAVPVTTAV